MALLFPADPLVWKTDFCPLGKLKEWLEAGKTGPLNPHLSDQEVAEYKSLIKTDIDTNLNWSAFSLRGVDIRAVSLFEVCLCSGTAPRLTIVRFPPPVLM